MTNANDGALGVLLSKTPWPMSSGASGCWFSGAPTLPESIAWPFSNQDWHKSVPMHFIAQINLAELPVAAMETGLPETGTLFFFYDPIFAPIHAFDFGGAKIIYVSDPVCDEPPREMPAFEQPLPDVEIGSWFRNNDTNPHRRWNMGLSEVASPIDQHPPLPVYPEDTTKEASGIWERSLLFFAQMGQPEKPAYAYDIDEAPQHNLMIGPGDWHDHYDYIPLLTVYFDPLIGLSDDDQRVLVFSLSEEKLLAREFDAARIIEWP